VLTSIDTNSVGNGDCLAGHGGALLVLFENPLNWLCEPLGAGARPVHPIRDASLRRTDWVAIEGIADMPAASRTSGCDATDPQRKRAPDFAVMHNANLTVFSYRSNGWNESP